MIKNLVKDALNNGPENFFRLQLVTPNNDGNRFLRKKFEKFSKVHRDISKVPFYYLSTPRKLPVRPWVMMNMKMKSVMMIFNFDQ